LQTRRRIGDVPNGRVVVPDNARRMVAIGINRRPGPLRHDDEWFLTHRRAAWRDQDLSGETASKWQHGVRTTVDWL
jgi:hypothetical protein